jgi:hypothetical protein
MNTRLVSGVALAAALMGMTGSGCKLLKKKASPPAVDAAKLEARLGQLSDSLQLVAQTQEMLSLRVDSLGDTLAIVASRRGGGGGGDGMRRSESAAEASETAQSVGAGDTIAADVARQKVIYANYKMLQGQAFAGDTVHSFLAKKYGVDSTTVEAIKQRGEEEGW